MHPCVYVYLIKTLININYTVDVHLESQALCKHFLKKIPASTS